MNTNQAMCDGYSLFAIYIDDHGKSSIYKADLRADTAIELARSVWRNNQPMDAVRVVNQKTGATRDQISRDPDANGPRSYHDPDGMFE